MELRCVISLEPQTWNYVVSYHACWIISVPFNGNDGSVQSICGAKITRTRNPKWEKLSCAIFPTINPIKCPQIGHNQAVRPVSRYLHYGTLMYLYQVQAKKLMLMNHTVKWCHFKHKCCASFQNILFLWQSVMFISNIQWNTIKMLKWIR